MTQFRLAKVDICGFRGFTQLQSIELGEPLTLLFGSNRQGKSSIVNAVEWCLFGPEVAAIKYGDIREREAWEVKNLNSPTCSVQCEFRSTDGRTIIARRTYKSQRTSDFFYQIDGGEKSAKEADLYTLLRLSIADFVSSVHLHPEIVRNLVIAKPGVRKEAIDRLLGLSELRDMVGVFAAENPNAWTDSLERDIIALDQRLEAALAEKNRVIKSESTELISAGFLPSDLNADGAVRYGAKLADNVQQFATKYRLSDPKIAAPIDFTELQSFDAQLAPAIQNLRGEHPVLADQSQLFIRKNSLDGLKSAYVSQREAVTKAELALNAFPEKRTPDDLEAEIISLAKEIAVLDADMSAVSKNAALLDRALTFFQDATEADALVCPLCGQGERTVGEWRSHLQKEIKTRNLEPLQLKKRALADKTLALRASKEKTIVLQRQIMQEREALLRTVAKVKELLGKEISANDDPLSILQAESEAVDASLRSLQEQVNVINSTLNGFQTATRELDRLCRVGKAHQEMANIEAINNSEAYKELKSIRDDCERFADDVELLIDGLQGAVTSEAGRRLEVAQAAISQIFTKLTDRPDFPGLKVSAGSDGYLIELTNSSGGTRTAMPLLNHADINCAALSIFLALASIPQISHQLGFVILDDPSQSLDAASKRNLCAVLSNLSDSQQVVLATADGELRAEALRMTKKKICYVVKNWTPSGGPVIDRQEDAAAHGV